VLEHEAGSRELPLEPLAAEALLPDAVDGRGACLLDHRVLAAREGELRVVDLALEHEVRSRPPEAVADARRPLGALRPVGGGRDDVEGEAPAGAKRLVDAQQQRRTVRVGEDAEVVLHEHDTYDAALLV